VKISRQLSQVKGERNNNNNNGAQVTIVPQKLTSKQKRSVSAIQSATLKLGAKKQSSGNRQGNGSVKQASVGNTNAGSAA